MSHSLLSTSATRRIQTISLPLYLIPAFAELRVNASWATSRPFFSTQCQSQNTKQHKSKQQKKRTKDKNQRGVSAIRGTGPRVPLSIKHVIRKAGLPENFLPKPDPNPEAKYADDRLFQTNPNHGLWDFFEPKKRPLLTPDQEGAFGRAWTYAELEPKGFEDLHALYWITFKERNRIRTRQAEHERHHAGYGRAEMEEKYDACTETMKQIKDVLIDRHDSWEEMHALIRSKWLKDLLPDEEDEGLFDEEEAAKGIREDVSGSIRKADAASETSLQPMSEAQKSAPELTAR